MNLGQESWIDERRAAVLIGLPIAELRRLSRLNGLGHVHLQPGEPAPQASDAGLVFTYEELTKLCFVAARPRH